jgi:hypothetical protein
MYSIARRDSMTVAPPDDRAYIEKMRTFLSIALLSAMLALPTAHGQESTPASGGSTFFPGGTLVVPYVGHMPEPVSGLRKEIGNSRMRLTIGAPLDVWELRFADDGRARLRLGIDFFMQALTTSSEGLRLQIDAADGWFGGHVTSRWDFRDASLALRLRILHLSGHMVDGHFDNETDTWKDGREPIPFTRDFGELSAAISTSLSSLTIRGFAGTSYATLIRPDNIKRWAFLGGFDLHTASLLASDGPFPLHLYAGYTLTLAGIPEYTGTNSIEAGVKFGEWEGTGIRVYAGYYAGQMMFTQYYDLRTEHWAIGFGFEL